MANVQTFPEWLPVVTPQWTWDWPFQQYIYKHLDNITTGTNDRLMISLPPRHTKSETVTVRYAAWRLIREPSLRIVVASYSQVMANKFSRRIRRIVAQFLELSHERNAADDWETLEGGGIRAVGRGGGITGQGADLIIIDDPVKNREEADSVAVRESTADWYADDLSTRLEPGGAIILIMTRWHEDDIAGRILASEEAAEWTVVNLPAIAEDADPIGRAPGEALCPDRYDVDMLNRRKRTLGERGFNALYQGRPSAAAGNIFKRHWWRFWYRPGDEPQPIIVRLEDGTLHTCIQEPLPDKFDGKALSYDCAFKDGASSDYVAGGSWAWVGTKKYLVAQQRERADFPRTLQMIREDIAIFKPDSVVVEDKANGSAIISVLRKEFDAVIPVNPEGGKDSRANAVTPIVEAGSVYLPHPSIAPWVRAFIEECSAFPAGTHDDQVDQMTQMLLRLRKREFGEDVYDRMDDREATAAEKLKEQQKRIKTDRAERAGTYKPEYWELDSEPGDEDEE